MNRRLVIVVTCILLGTTFIPVVESEFSGVKVPVRVSTSTGKTTEQMLSIEDVEKLSSMLNILQENPKDFEVYLPVVLRGLADLGLIEDASSLEKAILGNVKTLPSDDTSQDFEFLFNAFCFIAGWGYNSWLVTPMFFPCLGLIGLLYKILGPSAILELIGLILYVYLTLHPRVFVPIGGWFIAKIGDIHTLGLLGYQHKFVSRGYMLPPPSLFLIFGFTGLWVGFLLNGYETTFCIGSAVAIFGG